MKYRALIIVLQLLGTLEGQARNCDKEKEKFEECLTTATTTVISISQSKSSLPTTLTQCSKTYSVCLLTIKTNSLSYFSCLPVDIINGNDYIDCLW